MRMKGQQKMRAAVMLLMVVVYGRGEKGLGAMLILSY